MERIKGKEMTVAVDDQVITGSTECVMLIEATTKKVTHPHQENWERNIVKRKRWSVTTSHLLNTDNTGDVATLLGKKVWLSMKGRKALGDGFFKDYADTKTYEGWAYVSGIKVTASNKQMSIGVFEFTGTGKLNIL